MIDSISSPKTLDESGRPPETRMADAFSAQDRILELISADAEGRSERRRIVKGMVDGNAPYNSTDLRNAGRADACNVNWRIAESVLLDAVGAFYDVFSEVPMFAQIELNPEGVDPTKAADWSRIVSDQFHQLIASDSGWDYAMQQSQFDMVLYGIGPLFFENEYDWKNVAIPCRDLLLPDYTRSTTTKWDECAILSSYMPHQLYEQVMDESSATAVGWNVSAVKEAIIDAHPASHERSSHRSWEWHQDQLKTRSYAYSSESKVIHVAHYFIREFPVGSDDIGKISHFIVLNPEVGQNRGKVEYLYKKLRRYEEWTQIIHPMYYDNLGGGYHHSVTGLGVKMFSALDYLNRLLCNIADKAFAPKIFIVPTTANNDQELNLIRMGDYAKAPAGVDIKQTPVAGFTEEALNLAREIRNLVMANLSQYRRDISDRTGNPVTATEVQFQAAQMAQLSKTQLSRYYNQLDWLYAEKYRRAVANSSRELPGGKEAAEFRKQCIARGVPSKALSAIRSVRATRVVGQGSQAMRQSSLQFLLQVIGTLPKEGQENLLKDIIASYAGQFSVDRFYPSAEPQTEPDDNLAIAMVQIAAAKLGVPTVVTDTQEHVIFAGKFLEAATQAAASLQQGANPMEVYNFIDTLGPAIVAHIQAMSDDPTKKNIVAEFTKMWQELAKTTDKLREQIQKNQQQQMQQQANARSVMNEEQLKAWQLQQEEQRKNFQTAQEEQRRNRKIQQQLASKDLLLAQKVRANTVNMLQKPKNGEAD